MDGGSDCHSSNGTIWSRLTRFFGREDDESLEKAIIEARADGEVEPDEEPMLLGILRFNDLQVQDTMTPRTDIDCVPEDMLLPEVARVIVESGHSRIPVFRDTRDNMVGMLHAKDILSCLLDPKMADQPASAIMREPFFVPETKPIRNLLQEFRASKQHIAIALDEYGGTSGVVTMEDVVDGVVKKLIFRHPHVFGGAEPEKDAESVLVSWDAIKRREKGQQTTAQALDAVARSLPGLWRAEKLQSKAARDGFDWPDISGALDKLDEEVSELHRAAAGDGDMTEELGDVLFAAVKVGRFVGVDPEVAIHGTCEKFIRRYRAVEEGAAAMGKSVDQLPLETLEALWAEAKRS